MSIHSGVTPSEDVSGDTGKHGEISALIGTLKLKSEFDDPDVDVDHERLTAEHEVVTGHNTYTDNGVNFIVQGLGRMPPEIDITCWVTQSQLPIVEDPVTKDQISLRTSRYVGDAIPKEVDVAYSRTYHDKHGWIFEVTIQLLATQPNNFRAESPDGSWLQSLGIDPDDAPFPEPWPDEGAGGEK
jgi:hypothetical protein